MTGGRMSGPGRGLSSREGTPSIQPELISNHQKKLGPLRRERSRALGGCVCWALGWELRDAVLGNPSEFQAGAVDGSGVVSGTGSVPIAALKCRGKGGPVPVPHTPRDTLAALGCSDMPGGARRLQLP